ncbi:SIMPL domain-containing protein [Mangrovibacillus sp. Mu-81]|jgi:uncharacterized protein|uniref:SIMPL domain-containing protein n=1 Tax=Mangrovibacillus sp. Mu-81 TaxID=3121478 RepID=UPI002FE45B48
MNMYSYPSYFRANPNGRPGKITVTGEHKMYVDPDQAVVSLGVVTQGEDLEEAQRQNVQRSNRVVQSLVDNGIPKKDIQTSTYQIFPKYHYEDGKQIFMGYEVRHVFTITVSEIDSLGKIIDEAIKSGANRVENIQFVNSDPAKTYQQALAAAYHEAHEKALTLSNQSGQQLDPHPKSITEHSGTAVIPFAPTALVQGAEDSTSLQPGQIGVTASLTVEYRTY